MRETTAVGTRERKTAPVDRFPADVWSLKGMDLETWGDTCYWPVPDAELRGLFAAVDALLVESLNSAGEELGDAFCVLFNVVSEYCVALIHARMVLDRAAKDGIAFEFDDERTRFYGELLGDGHLSRAPDWAARLPKKPTWWERARCRARVVIDEIRFHRFDWAYWLGLAKGPHYLCFHQPSADKRRFAADRGRRIRILHPRIFMRGFGYEEPEVPGDSAAAGTFVQGLAGIARRHGVPLRDAETAAIENLILVSLRKVCAAIACIRPQTALFPATSILLDGLGNLFKRCFLMAARREGHRIVGFTHGHTFGMGNVGSFAYVEIGMLDTYVVPTPHSAVLFGKLTERYPMQRSRRAEIVVQEEAVYRELWEAGKAKALPATVKMVMFVECALTGYMDRDTLFFWPYQLDITVQAALALRDRGIRTVLKRHPDRLAESARLYEPYFDTIVDGRFENVYEMADVLFFPHTSSTTFGFSLLTKKPIVFFDAMLETIWGDMHGPLRKRCRVVPSRFDDRGRLVFDGDILAAAVLRPPEEPDQEMAARFMLDRP